MARGFEGEGGGEVAAVGGGGGDIFGFLDARGNIFWRVGSFLFNHDAAASSDQIILRWAAAAARRQAMDDDEQPTHTRDLMTNSSSVCDEHVIQENPLHKPI